MVQAKKASRGSGSSAAKKPSRPKASGKPKPAAKSGAKAGPKPAAKAPPKSTVKPSAPPPVPETQPLPIPLGNDPMRVLSLQFVRDGDEYLARLESAGGHITELKNRSLDQLLTMVAGELEDLLS